MGNCFRKDDFGSDSQLDSKNIHFNNNNNNNNNSNIKSKQIDTQFTTIINQDLINELNARQINSIINENKINYQKIQSVGANIEMKSEEKANFVALFDYERATKDDMTIKKNDKLFVMDKTHPDWWLAKNLRTMETGYVPFNYITAVDNLEIKEWYFPSCTRREAERLLEYLENEPGMFLIRESEQDKGNGWSLSILDYSDQRERHTKHYKIRKMDNGGCYISPKKTFQSLDELVQYYSKNANGLCRSLTKACPKLVKDVGVKDVWEEDRANIELGPLIGSGNYGDVYKGLWRKKYTVAVKTIKLSNANDPNRDNRIEDAKYREFLRESDIMKKLRHDKLVKLWCVCTTGEPIYIVTEYMVNGNLLKYLREGNGRYLRFKDIIDMASQIASGMKYLESCRCVHRDLAARNILVGERNIVKIADFGFAQMLNKDEKLELSKEETKFPVKWTAPEVFTVDPITLVRQYTIKSDVWSFGILLYELITLGQNPYPTMSHAEVIRKVKDENYRMPKPQGLCTDSYYNMMLKCWNEDPNKRPTFDALYHYFNDYFVNTEPCYRDPGY